MSTKPHLAPELLVQIFHLLPPAAQLACLSVCKSWHTTVKPIYFSQISLLPETDLSLLTSSLQTTGACVQSLTIKTRNIKVTYKGLMDLIKCCPFLLQLTLDTIYFEWVWFEALQLNRVKSVSIGDLSWRLGNDNQYFYRVAYQYRDSIEDLHIPCTCDQVLQDVFDGIMKYLAHFENLKCLRLVHGSQSVPVYFDTLLDACKGLETLVIELGHPLYPPTTSSTRPKSVYKSMRQLDIFLTMFSIEYLRYIMDRFVNITVLDVSINQSTLDWERDEQDICNFMQHTYYPFIKTLSRSSLTIKMNGSSTMGDLSAQFFCTNEEVKSVRFQLDCSRSERTDVVLETKNGDTHLNFLFVRALYDCIESPFVNHLQKYGKHIKSLELNISKYVTRLHSLDIDFIMHHCRNLEKIHITVENNYPNTILFLIISSAQHNDFYNTVSNFTLEGGTMVPDLLPFIFSHLLNLKTLHLVKCKFLSESEVTVFDMTKLKSLDLFVFDTKASTFRDTCFILTNVHCDITKCYLLDHDTGEIRVREDHSIPPCTDTITFVFNQSVKIEIHIGQQGTKRITTFP
ncbi:hypothetical protein HPULCUR_011155 [Helicostylum pulchrum]|uniref:F-box domain-containing protein n=1 Tax=Helicostylum pulchrum TaxID=562976 RepID=A0ABP9YF98_9FUNG